MREVVQRLGYVLDLASNTWLRPDYEGIPYSDGDEVEERIAAVIQQASDISVLSPELRQHCSDWASLYHLSASRANIMRPFRKALDADVLEIGAGCGAITRYLGECGANVLALEGSPARAAIARSRTRDLGNVTVLAERFDQFQSDHRFDVVTLIGVLEYASVFTSGQNPHLTMLERARSLLKPAGKLIIAIENQLGLKYFAGAPEDHLGQPMYGVEGRYLADQPQTLGRAVLAENLKKSGFAAVEFLSPLPDYKLPISILTEEGVDCDEFDAGAFAWQSARRDPQIPPLSTFSLELAWPTVFANRLALDLANSFLVVASPRVQKLVEARVLAYHYSTERKPEFCKETVFKRQKDGKVRIQYSRLGGTNDRASRNALVSFICPSSDRYSFGKPLSLEFVQIVTRDGWSIDEVARFAMRYVDMLVAIAREQGDQIDFGSPYSLVPGALFDAVAQNLIVRDDGHVLLIDREWELRSPIELGHLLFRTLLQLIGSVTRFGRNCQGQTMTRHQFVDGVLQAAHLGLNATDYCRYLEIEEQITEEVIGRSAAEAVKWWPDHPLPTLSLSQAVAERDVELGSVRQALSVRDEQIIGLNRAAVACDEQIASLNQGLVEQEARIESIGRQLAERDTQIARLGQTQVDLERQVAGLRQQVAEQDTRFVDLERTRVDRDRRIYALENEVSDRDARLLDLGSELARRDAQVADLKAAVAGLETRTREMLASNSWRLTAPLRAVRRTLLSRPYARVRQLVSDTTRGAWARLPVSNARKQRFKDRLFRRLPHLFGWSAAYRSWRNLRGDPAPALSRGTAVPQSRSSPLRQPGFVPLLNAPTLVDVPARVIAFYLPQYHAIPENDEWWGEGFTEWTNVRAAQPQFVGHHQPRIPGELGYYDLLDPGVQRRQVELAQLYGIGGFCFYFYWFGGRTLLEQPIRNYLEDGSLGLPFCLCWANENWTRSWDGLDNDVLLGQAHSAADDLAFIKHVSRYLRDARYIRIGGKPLLIVYRPSLLPSAAQTATRWRRWCTSNGMGEIYLAYVQSFDGGDPRAFGFDAAIEFPPNNSRVPNVTDRVQPVREDFACTIYEWRALVERSRQYADAGYKLFRTVCPSWDNTARRRNRGSVLLNNSPHGYQQWLYNAIVDTCRRRQDPDERLVFVNAWNEWAEGAYLEPDGVYGYAFLEATRMALVRAGAAREAAPVDPLQSVAIVIHAFYLDVLGEILRYVERLRSISFRLYVSCAAENAQAVGARLTSTGHAFHLMPGPNRGRDALPFLKMLPIVIGQGHDLIIKVHTKKSLHRHDGDLWRRELFDELLADSAIRAALDHFLQYPDTGILGPAGHVVPMSYYWGSNAERVLHYSERLGVDRSRVESLDFVAGHMLIARASALAPLSSLAIDEQSFEPEQGQTDGTMAHAIERIVSVSAEAASLLTRSANANGRAARDFPYA